MHFFIQRIWVFVFLVQHTSNYWSVIFDFQFFVTAPTMINDIIITIYNIFWRKSIRETFFYIPISRGKKEKACISLKAKGGKEITMPVGWVGDKLLEWIPYIKIKKKVLFLWMYVFKLMFSFLSLPSSILHKMSVLTRCTLLSSPIGHGVSCVLGNLLFSSRTDSQLSGSALFWTHLFSPLTRLIFL